MRMRPAVYRVIFLSALSTPPYRVKCFRQGPWCGWPLRIFCVHIHAPLSHRCSHHAAPRSSPFPSAYSSQRASSAMFTIGRECPVDTIGTGFGRYFAYLHRLGIPWAGEGERDREHRFCNHELRPYLRAVDAQTAVLDGDFLQSLDLVEPFDIENSAHVALGDIAASPEVSSAPPVVMSPATIRFSWPIFSCSVIFAISWSIYSFMGRILPFLVVAVTFLRGCGMGELGAAIEPAKRNVSDKVLFSLFIMLIVIL